MGLSRLGYGLASNTGMAPRCSVVQLGASGRSAPIQPDARRGAGPRREAGRIRQGSSRMVRVHEGLPGRPGKLGPDGDERARRDSKSGSSHQHDRLHRSLARVGDYCRFVVHRRKHRGARADTKTGVRAEGFARPVTLPRSARQAPRLSIIRKVAVPLASGSAGSG